MTTGTKPKLVKIETLGCQMNLADSERMMGLLAQMGYESTEQVETADLVIINTCSIREKAVDKLAGHLGALKTVKNTVNPKLVIGVAGCVPQHEKDKLLQKAPYVDLVFGTFNFHRLPDMLAEHEESGNRVVQVLSRPDDDLPEDLPVQRQGKYHAWVTIIHGCDKFCTYCVVPYTRGREKSRQPEAIMREIRQLASEGFKEVTLLGQNVTAYGKELAEPSSLADLLRQINDVEGIERIRFLTGHPIDTDEELVEAVATLPKVCEYFHIPIQAGDDLTLKRMNRRYTLAQYTDMVEMIRKRIPHAAITGDMIVGFPGETEEQFMNTVEAVRRFKFDLNNTASYSIRSHTPAATHPNQVEEEEKARRLQYLNQVTREVALECNQKYVGTIQEIFVDGPSPDRSGRMTGRTRTNKIVHFEGLIEMEGHLVHVPIEKASSFSLRGGRPVEYDTFAKKAEAVLV